MNVNITAEVLTIRVRGVQVGEITQSERDWAYAKRHLANGESPEALIRSIAHFRQDKARPRILFSANGDSRLRIRRIESG